MDGPLENVRNVVYNTSTEGYQYKYLLACAIEHKAVPSTSFFFLNALQCMLYVHIVRNFEKIRGFVKEIVVKNRGKFCPIKFLPYPHLLPSKPENCVSLKSPTKK